MVAIEAERELIEMLPPFPAILGRQDLSNDLVIPNNPLDSNPHTHENRVTSRHRHWKRFIRMEMKPSLQILGPPFPGRNGLNPSDRIRRLRVGRHTRTEKWRGQLSCKVRERERTGTGNKGKKKRGSGKARHDASMLNGWEWLMNQPFFLSLRPFYCFTH